MSKDASFAIQLTNNGTGKPSLPWKNKIISGCLSSPPQRKSLFLGFVVCLFFFSSPLFKPLRSLHKY